MDINATMKINEEREFGIDKVERQGIQNNVEKYIQICLATCVKYRLHWQNKNKILEKKSLPKKVIRNGLFQEKPNRYEGLRTYYFEPFILE